MGRWAEEQQLSPPPLPPGLCGNFNQNQADDFRTVGGVVEATAAAFANTWKTQAACPNVKNSFEDPCSLMKTGLSNLRMSPPPTSSLSNRLAQHFICACGTISFSK